MNAHSRKFLHAQSADTRKRIAHTLPHDFLIEPHIYFLEAHAPPLT